MIYLFQTKKHNNQQNGNCLRTAMACLLEINPDDLPSFEDMDKKEWRNKLIEWCIDNNIIVKMHKKDIKLNEPYLAIGYCDTGTKHCVIYENGALIHDPDERHRGLVEVTESWQLNKMK